MSSLISKCLSKFINMSTNNFLNEVREGYKDVKPLYAEDILYPTQVYPIYVLAQNNFKFCMQNKLLKRNDILEFKSMLNNCIDFKDYRFLKFKNDAHEIYTKLKSHNISRQEMLQLNSYLYQFLTVIPEPVKVYGHLQVIK